MKISVITVVYNGQDSIERCMNSVFAQTYPDIEYIIIDGNSTDATCKLIEPHLHKIAHFISEPDQGIYDAMNKGIALATGGIVGTLNADDAFAADDVLEYIAQAFNNDHVDAVFGDLKYVNTTGKILRYWKSKVYNRNDFAWGWMPAHPTFYVRRHFFEAYGSYLTNLGTAADYELMLRFLYKRRLNAWYIPKVLVNMQAGGVSNKNLQARMRASMNDLKAMRANSLSMPYGVLLMKPLRKVFQFFPFK